MTDAGNHPHRFGDLLARHGLKIPEGIAPATDPIPVGETPEDKAARLAIQNRNRLARYARQRPAAFADAHLDDLTEADRRVVLDWFASGARTLVISGAVGVGKSHAAYALANHATEQGIDAAAWTVPDLLVALAPEGDPDALWRSRSAGLLVLDDLGVEKTSEWRVEQVTALIDARSREGLRQVVTTNAGYRQLADRYGDRTMSRLTGGAVLVKLTGPDRRRVTW